MDFVTVLTGLGVLIGAFALYFAWEATLAKVLKPAMDIRAISRLADESNWISLHWFARNIEPTEWTIENVQAARPVGVKLATYGRLPKKAAENEWTPAEPDFDAVDPSQLSNSVALSVALAPMGRKSNTLINGMNDTAYHELWVFVPPFVQSHDLSITFSLRSIVHHHRTFNTTLAAKIPPRNRFAKD